VLNCPSLVHSSLLEENVLSEITPGEIAKKFRRYLITIVIQVLVMFYSCLFDAELFLAGS